MKPAFVMLVVCARIYQSEKNRGPTGVIFPMSIIKCAVGVMYNNSK